MVSNINSTILNGIDQVVNELYKKVKTSDTDESSFLKTLSKQLDTLDTDGDGNLSTNDLETAISQKFPEYSQFAALQDGNLSDLGKGLSNFSSAFMKQAINSYQSSGLSDLVSNLHLV